MTLKLDLSVSLATLGSVTLALPRSESEGDGYEARPRDFLIM